MDDETDKLPAILGVASMIAAAVAWAPAVGFTIAIGLARRDVDGFGCTLDEYGSWAAIGSSAATVVFALVATVLALVSFTRGLRSPSAGGLAAAVVGLSAAGGAFLASPTSLFFWGVFNDSLCWTRHIVIGRPLRVRSVPRFAAAVSRSDWANGPTPDAITDDVLRTRRADEWTRVGLGEHAAVAAFAKLVLDLVAHGAPPHLIRRSLEAAIDEVRHAERAFAVASAYADRPVGPGTLSDGSETPMDTLLEETWTDGVVGERESARVLRSQAAICCDPSVAAVLTEAADDEDGHATLAEDIVAWASVAPRRDRTDPRGVEPEGNRLGYR